LPIKLVEYVHWSVINVQRNPNSRQELAHAWILGLKLDQVVS
jgi:hypothetical protein